jgi:hypothetical protein
VKEFDNLAKSEEGIAALGTEEKMRRAARAWTKVMEEK